MKYLLPLFLAFMLLSCSPTAKERDIAISECTDFITQQMEATEVKVLDTYMKHGKIVVELGYQDRYTTGSALNIRLCVVDLESGSLRSPGVFNEKEWRK